MKEALRRLQAVHLADKKSFESREAELTAELESIREENDRLFDAEQRAEELKVQLEINNEEMKDLAQVGYYFDLCRVGV